MYYRNRYGIGWEISKLLLRNGNTMTPGVIKTSRTDKCPNKGILTY